MTHIDWLLMRSKHALLLRMCVFVGCCALATLIAAQTTNNPFDGKRTRPPLASPTTSPSSLYNAVIHMPTGDSRIVSGVSLPEAMACIKAAQQYTVQGSWAGTIWRAGRPQSSGIKYYGDAR